MVARLTKFLEAPGPAYANGVTPSRVMNRVCWLYEAAALSSETH
jgi:hypothetical protein